MQNIRLAIGLCVLCLIASGCAVTEPDNRDTARVRAAMQDGEAYSIPGLASDLGISEVAVVSALPGPMAVKLPADDLQTVLADLCQLAPVHIAFAGSGAQPDLSLSAPLVVERSVDDRVVLYSEPSQARVRLNPADLVYIWLLRLPAERGEELSVGFYGSGGERNMLWTVERDPENARRFEMLWDRYAE